MRFKTKKHRIAALTLAVSGIVSIDSQAHAQVAVNVSVNASSPITYANGAATATMPATGLGLCSSVYANMWGDPALPGDIAASGVQLVRYPGGSYSDIYNWSLNTANEGGYVGPHADMGNFFNVINAAGTQAMITVNYGSNTTDTMGAQPQEAAAEVAFADANPNIYGTSSDVTLGTDAAGVNWYTAGYWAKLRASTPAQYESWATAAGDYNPAYAFLAIGHSAPENIQYWEIGNEIGGNGWLGYQWEYDLHAPYNNGNTSDNTGRYHNPLLSPTAYAQNLNQFATLMKQVDPNIKIGAGFDAQANSTGDAAILQTAGNNIDFGIIHWYPTGSLPSMITSTLPAEIANLRTSVQNNTNKGYNGIEIDVTEFGDGNSSPPTVENALFAADAYATGFENGLKNMNFQEMSTSAYLNGNGTAGNPGEVYYAIQMVSKYASTGDTFVSTSSNNSSLRIHADRKPDGSIGLLLINDSTTSADTLSVNLSGADPLTSSGTLYLFGNSNISGSTTTAPTSQNLTGLGTSFSLSIPLETIETLVIPALYLSWDNAGGTGSGANWDTSSQNWNNGSGPANYVSAVNVNFTDNNNGHYAVTLNTTVTPNLISVNNSSGNYVISGSGTIAGAGSLTKSGSGSLTLNTANTYTGATNVNAGALNIQNGGALAGTSSVTVTSGAALQLQGGISTTTAVGLTLNGAGISTNGALENVSGSNTYSGLIALGSNSTIGSDAGTLILSNTGTITGSGNNLTLTGSGNGTLASIIGTGAAAVTKSGSGTWTLTGANSYTGVTNVNAGALNIQNGGALADSSSVTVASGAALQLQGGISTTTAVGLTLNGTGTAANGALENVSGSNTYSGLITLGSNSTIGSDAGTLTLSNTGTITGSGDNLTLTGSGNGTLASFIGTNTGTLTKSGSGTWTLTGANTYTGVTNVNAGALNIHNGSALADTASVTVASGAALQLQGGISTTAAVGLTLNGTGTATNGALENVAGSNTYSGLIALGSNSTIGSDAGTLTLSNTGTIIGSGNNLTLTGSGNGNLASIIGTGAGTLAKSGSGTWTLNGANTYTGETVVNAGTLVVGVNGALPDAGVSVTGGTLQLGAGTGQAQMTSLSITGNGVLDVDNNHFILAYGASDPITTIAGYIKSGYDGGGWDGIGINSSAAIWWTDDLRYGVGYADGKDGVVSGLTSGQIEVAYTLLGDANLDGLVNGSDFNILAANFNQSITGWDQGDFNYDGLVNAADFNELAANFNQGVSGADVSAGDVAALDAFAVANGLSVPTSSVPEPASAVMMVMAGLGILSRRRRWS